MRAPIAASSMVRGLTAKGLSTGNFRVSTEAGLRWALACLHPCNEALTEAVAYPDSSQMNSHCTRMQRTVTISPPQVDCNATGGPSIDQCSWNLIVVTTPWPEYPWLVCATKGNDEPPTIAKYVSEGHLFHNGDAKGLSAWGAWYFYSFPNFMDSAQFGTGNDANDLKKKYQKIRVVAKGTTTYLNASRLYDGGRVICGQYPVAARYIDTFNPKSVSIDMEALVDSVIKRLCVTGSQSPEELRELTKHVHPIEVGNIGATAYTDVVGEVKVDKPAVNAAVFIPDTFIPKTPIETTVTRGDVRVNRTQDVGVQIADKITATVPSGLFSHKHGTQVQNINRNTFASFLAHEHTTPVEFSATQLNAATRHDHQVKLDDVVYTHVPKTALEEASGRTWKKDVAFGITQTEFATGDPKAQPNAGSGFLYTDAKSNNTSYTGSESSMAFGGEDTVAWSNSTEALTVNTPKLNVTQPIIEVDVDVPGVDAYLPRTKVPIPEPTTRVILGDIVAKHNLSAKTGVAVTTPTAKSGEPVYVDPLADTHQADACLKITKQGDALEPAKLIKDDTVKDHPDWYYSEPPVQENRLFYGDPKATTWEARKGTYQVMRLENMELDEVHSGSATFYDLGLTAEEIKPTEYKQTLTTNIAGTGTWAVAYYRNINLATSVTLKSVQFTEGIVNPLGPFANLTPMSVDPDIAAVDLVAAEQRRLAHAYPSAYNDLSKILGEVFNVAKSVGKAVNAAAGQLGGVPVVGGIAQVISKILSGIGL